ncbi:hypothetical protein IWQ60_009943 [Tieghemiomyces parasiticus]|uniref:Uncharacterized protein n=1 Tax=Tieghemiomyces parasiticus TaxID=78921 RepID=A0A9W8DNI5_9FUNG|nr:hypothetical protein IWQ60_009943 [Tieghemiomyces parasiticus]
MAHTLPPSVRASLHNGETPVYGVCAGSGSPHGHGPGYVNEATSTTAAVVAAEGGGNSTDGTPTLATTATGSDEVPPFIARSFSAPDHLASFPSGLFSPPILPPDFYAAPYYTRRKSLPLADDSHPDTTKAWGYVLLVVTFVVFAVGVYTTMVSKVLPVTGNRFLDAVRDDQYYCLLAPLTLTVAFYTVIWNWLGMKIFRHN